MTSSHGNEEEEEDDDDDECTLQIHAHTSVSS